MIKLTGGSLKGRTIKSVHGQTTRPSSAKVREAIFNIIGGKVIESDWLDLFGGTGAIGLEALSRDAAHVTFIEKDFGALRCLKNNVSLLNLKSMVTLFKGDAISFLKTSQESFDFIFIDPPYRSDYYENTFLLINKNQELLKAGGVLIVEHLTKAILPEIFLDRLKSYKYGDTTLTLYTKENENN